MSTSWYSTFTVTLSRWKTGRGPVVARSRSRLWNRRTPPVQVHCTGGVRLFQRRDRLRATTGPLPVFHRLKVTVNVEYQLVLIVDAPFTPAFMVDYKALDIYKQQ